jgi:hypothetical protein
MQQWARCCRPDRTIDTKAEEMERKRKEKRGRGGDEEIGDGVRGMRERGF